MQPFKTLQPRLALTLLCLASSASAQNLTSLFSGDYAVDDLASVPGLPSPYGGMVLKEGDPDTLLIIGACNLPSSAIYEVGLSRDTDGHIDGFVGAATAVANVPLSDGALSYAPGGVLLYTTYEWPNPSHLGQIRPGSTSADKLTPIGSFVGVPAHSGGVSLVPSGFPGAGRLKFTTYADEWYDAELVPDGMGTFNVVQAQQRAVVTPTGAWNIASFIFVDETYPGFSAPSVLICELSLNRVSAYELDANGDILAATRRPFLFGVEPYLGSALDPRTGDFLFDDWGGSDHVEVVRRLIGPVGLNYCGPAVANSTGQAGEISAIGTSIVANNEVELVASALPAAATCFFMASRTQGLAPTAGGSMGTLCLGGSIGRFVGPGQVLQTDSTGTARLAVDLSLMPTPVGLVSVQAGEVWSFQAWHRDLVGGAPTSNFTNGIAVSFR